METRANYVLIGVFTFAVIAAAFGFVFWFHHSAGKSKSVNYRVIFDGSVLGLRTGSSVLFNGIRVGEVTKLNLNPQDPGQVVAIISVLKSTPVRSDTRAGLDFQGLTGVASVALKGGTMSTPPLEGDEDEPPTLTAEHGATQDLTQAVRDVLNRADTVLVENQAALHQAVENINIFAEALARNSERVDRIMAGVENLTGGPDGQGDLQEAARSIRQLADNLDKRTSEITVGVNRLTATGAKQIDILASDARRTLGNIDKAVSDLARNPQRILFGGGSSTTEPASSRR